jgi:hypothetical protein
LRNVSFTESNVSHIANDRPFDAVVGRFILMWLPDPVSVLRGLSQLVRPGGVLAFQEVSYAPFLALCARLPLWLATASLLHEVMRRSGANTEAGVELHQMFLETGLPAPTMRMEILLGADPDFTRWIYDLLCSLRPQVQQQNLSLEPLGDFETLPARLQSEVAASKSVVPFGGLVGAWARKSRGDASL